MKKFAIYIFSYKASYFDLFNMGLSMKLISNFGPWIGFSVLISLAIFSGAMTYYCRSTATPKT